MSGFSKSYSREALYLPVLLHGLPVISSSTLCLELDDWMRKYDDDDDDDDDNDDDGVHTAAKVVWGVSATLAAPRSYKTINP